MFGQLYFKRFKPYDCKHDFAPTKDLKYIVVIPCSNERFTIFRTLQSLFDTDNIDADIEVIIAVNTPLNADKKLVEINRETYSEINKWTKINKKTNIKVHTILYENVPLKYAGAGFARRIGMDCALKRFALINRPEGVIISLDADSIVDKNYFVEINKHYERFPKTNATTIYFEHPLSGNEYQTQIYDAITLYELHLRYYIEALRYSGFPYAYHTIGSAFTVKAEVYAKQGGMNRKKAGEDFYFLHKIIPLGNFYEINSTRVIPSPRISDRVPFGTGVVVNRIINDNFSYKTFPFEAFICLKSFFDSIEFFFYDKFKLPECMKFFLLQNNFYGEIRQIKDNTSNFSGFVKRFFSWFNAFRVVKFMNFYQQNITPKQEVTAMAAELINTVYKTKTADNPQQLLTFLRTIQRIDS